MNRRRFLSLLTAGAAGMVLDPERALWVPGAKTIFLPSATTVVGWDPGFGPSIGASVLVFCDGRKWTVITPEFAVKVRP